MSLVHGCSHMHQHYVAVMKTSLAEVLQIGKSLFCYSPFAAHRYTVLYSLRSTVL